MSSSATIVFECIKIIKISTNVSFAGQIDPQMCVLLVSLVLKVKGVLCLSVWSIKLLTQDTLEDVCL
jgi:uncharacterized membrane protein YfbV (UPF0208 family)